MFTITANPFAEMTQGLSSLPRTSSSSVLQSPPIEPDYNYYHKPKERSNSCWKVVLVVLGLLSAFGLLLWVTIQEIAKNDKKKKLEEEKKQRELLEKDYQ